MLTQWRKECNLGPVQCFALFGYDSTDLVQGAPNHSRTKQLADEFFILPRINAAVKRSKNVKHILVHCSRNKTKKPSKDLLQNDACNHDILLPRPEQCLFAGDICITFAIVCQWEGLTCAWTHSRDISINLQFPSKPKSPLLGHPCPMRTKLPLPFLFWHGWHSPSLVIKCKRKK